MREICLYGSEGGGSSRFSLPLSSAPPIPLDARQRIAGMTVLQQAVH